MLKKFEINRTKIRGSYQLGRKVVPHDSKSDLPLFFLLRWEGHRYLEKKKFVISFEKIRRNKMSSQ